MGVIGHLYVKYGDKKELPKSICSSTTQKYSLANIT